jgi:hemoglobin
VPRDLDSAAAIDAFVDAFYDRVLADPLLAPLFIDVAGISLEAHLPRIKAYWRKMLLGEREYRRHMMAQHRAVDAQARFRAEHYARWLAHFDATLAAGYRGPASDRAKTLARRVAGNMRRNLESTRASSST